jgi:hypothetical protein
MSIAVILALVVTQPALADQAPGMEVSVDKGIDKALLRKRGEATERSFAHVYETGGMRRVHLRGRENILKRVLVHVGGFDLSLVMRKYIGKGTPRGLQGLIPSLVRLGCTILRAMAWFQAALGRFQGTTTPCRAQALYSLGPRQTDFCHGLLDH